MKIYSFNSPQATPLYQPWLVSTIVKSVSTIVKSALSRVVNSVSKDKTLPLKVLSRKIKIKSRKSSLGRPVLQQGLYQFVPNFLGKINFMQTKKGPLKPSTRVVSLIRFKWLNRATWLLGFSAYGEP